MLEDSENSMARIRLSSDWKTSAETTQPIDTARLPKESLKSELMGLAGHRSREHGNPPNIPGFVPALNFEVGRRSKAAVARFSKHLLLGEDRVAEFVSLQ